MNKKIHAGKQGKHIVGHNNYIQGRSIFNGTADDAQALIDDFAGTGKWINDVKEVVDFGKIIGQYADPSTGRLVNTTRGIIHYSSKGTHIVPANPIGW
ncbi:MAG: polymorphic toxin type 50 domain-containing protein [Vallitalea sp.]|nr:polymorphic toxin type 50 domain-containing protein [Vallitalea sp.]MCT4597687.1 polymorphic toxin type 50 domain-containing protein [Vallitalea sp.]